MEIPNLGLEREGLNKPIDKDFLWAFLHQFIRDPKEIWVLWKDGSDLGKTSHDTLTTPLSS